MVPKEIVKLLQTGPYISRELKPIVYSNEESCLMCTGVRTECTSIQVNLKFQRLVRSKDSAMWTKNFMENIEAQM